MDVANRAAMVVRMCDCRRIYLWECAVSDVAESMARTYTRLGPVRSMLNITATIANNTNDFWASPTP